MLGTVKYIMFFIPIVNLSKNLLSEKWTSELSLYKNQSIRLEYALAHTSVKNPGERKRQCFEYTKLQHQQKKKSSMTIISGLKCSLLLKHIGIDAPVLMLSIKLVTILIHPTLFNVADLSTYVRDHWVTLVPAIKCSIPKRFGQRYILWLNSTWLSAFDL